MIDFDEGSNLKTWRYGLAFVFYLTALLCLPFMVSNEHALMVILMSIEAHYISMVMLLVSVFAQLAMIVKPTRNLAMMFNGVAILTFIILVNYKDYIELVL